MVQMLSLFAVAMTGTALHATALKVHDSSAMPGSKDLVFMHIPYNFGHTVEVRHALPPLLSSYFGGINRGGFHNTNMTSGPESEGLTALTKLVKLTKPEAAWGRLAEQLNVKSDVSGCDMYFTPPKYWPEDMARNYFGDKTSFGILRDPYERLVSQFRGNLHDYGGFPNEFTETCDVNGGIKAAMRDFIAGGNLFAKECAFLPQAEYFDGDYGIKLPIDNRRFPTSMNEAFKVHGYPDHIATEQIFHVDGCDNVWAGDLDAETKALVRQVYARDFELLCHHFGYCDNEENVCLQEVENMCPDKAFKWDPFMKKYLPRV